MLWGTFRLCSAWLALPASSLLFGLFTASFWQAGSRADALRHPVLARPQERAHAVIWAKGEFAEVMGGTIGGRWVGNHRMAARLHGGERYQMFSFAGAEGAALGTKPSPPEEDGLDHLDIKPHLPGQSEAVGVQCDWNPQPRKPRLESVRQSVYRQAVAAILREHGLSRATPRIQHILRVDLDGDGEDEVLLQAGNAEGGTVIRPFYSFVALRKVVNGKVKTFLLRSQFLAGGSRARQARFQSESVRLSGVLDLNGDGKMEVVTTWEGWERGGHDAYLVQRNGVTSVLSTSFSE